MKRRARPDPHRSFLSRPSLHNVLTSDRLRLEPLAMAHFEQLYYLNSDMQVMRYISGRKISVDETLDYIDHIGQNWRELGFSAWAILSLADNQFVGCCGIQHIEFNRENPVEFGWRLKQNRWGQGFATEAATMMLRFAHAHTDIAALHAVCHPENIPSIRVTQRLSMQSIGMQKWYGLDTQVFRLDRPQFLDHLTASAHIFDGTNAQNIACHAVHG